MFGKIQIRIKLLTLLIITNPEKEKRKSNKVSDSNNFGQ